MFLKAVSRTLGLELGLTRLLELSRERMKVGFVHYYWYANDVQTQLVSHCHWAGRGFTASMPVSLAGTLSLPFGNDLDFQKNGSLSCKGCWAEVGSSRSSEIATGAQPCCLVWKQDFCPVPLYLRILIIDYKFISWKDCFNCSNMYPIWSSLLRGIVFLPLLIDTKWDI